MGPEEADSKRGQGKAEGIVGQGCVNFKTDD